jgi:hypothetical protein
MKSWDSGLQTDVAILDLSKAFDMVPHQALLGKLKHYGVVGCVHSWINDFLSGRSQSVVVDGSSSSWESVRSGVPQGTVLGPILFLAHINDLPSVITSEVRLFADDCLVYRNITSDQDQQQLQHDLDALSTWSRTWGMKYNPSKCNILSISRRRSKLHYPYALEGQTLEHVAQAKYLGIQLRDDLKWSTHVQDITAKASRTLGFLYRNLSTCPLKLKNTAYLALVRPLLEYSAAAWDPHLAKDIKLLENVQRRAARFVLNLHPKDHTSITTAIKNLKWQTLQIRRRNQRLTFVYKMINDLIAVPVLDYLTRASTRTRSNHPHKFNHVQASTNQFKNSFFPRTIVDWNRLTEDTVCSSSVDSFKNKLSRM